MAIDTHVIRLGDDAYELLVHEAHRRGVEPDALADELLRADLARPDSDVERALAALADMRERLPQVNGLALATESRADLERRSI